jgi:hypothetical protein
MYAPYATGDLPVLLPQNSFQLVIVEFCNVIYFLKKYSIMGGVFILENKQTVRLEVFTVFHYRSAYITVPN